MGIIDSFLSKIQWQSAPATVSQPAPDMHQRIRRGGAPTHAQRRSFAAGQTDRLTASWSTADETINMSLLRDLRVMRARSRAWERNDEYGRKFFRLIQTNIVGHAGIALKMDCRRPDGTVDQPDCDRIERMHGRWWQAGELDVTGKLSGAMFERLVTKMVARDGEVLVRIVTGSDQGVHRIRVQLLPGHLLDEAHNVDLANGNRIRMGVEFDRWMKPVAYHIRVQDKSADLYGQHSQRYDRLPAAEIIHLFVPEEVDQWRGYPWAYVALRPARQLHQFEEAALVAANVGAAKMGFFQQKDPDAAPLGAEGTDDENGDFTVEASPGSFDIIPDGYELKEYDPTYPNEVFSPFTATVARRLATGLLTSYHTLTGDLTGVNYSSIRTGVLDERDNWMVLQDWLISDLRRRLFSAWLPRAIMYDAEGGQLPLSKIQKFDAPLFYARRWDWVDPQSDMTANEKAVGLGVKSRAGIIRERGHDPEKVWKELDDEKARGFTPPAGSGQHQQPQPNQAGTAA
jgi:lambda family phage portal protein